MKQRTGVSRNLLKHKVTGKGESAFYEKDVRACPSMFLGWGEEVCVSKAVLKR
jgi:hypothetical protein